jgi:hypothetical protein
MGPARGLQGGWDGLHGCRQGEPSHVKLSLAEGPELGCGDALSKPLGLQPENVTVDAAQAGCQ